MSLRPARHRSHRRLDRTETAISKIASTARDGMGAAIGGRVFVTVSFASTVAEWSQPGRFYRVKLHSIQPRSSRGDQMGRSRERPFFVAMRFLPVRVR
jgi:hypothetical protein